MKKCLLTIFLIGISISLVAQPSNPFTGFKFMSLPRDYMPIGALWNVEAGPIGDGVGEDKRKNGASFSMLDMVMNTSQKNELELGILNFLKLRGKYAALSDISVNLNKLEIVTLNSVDILKSNVGEQVVYEALKAQEMTITIDKNKSADAQLDLLQIFKKVNIDAENTTGNKAKITAKGMNLYLAYRIIQIENGNQNKEKVSFKKQSYSGHNSVTFSNRYEANTDKYTIQICPCQIISCMLKKANEGSTLDMHQLLRRCGVDIGFDLTIILKDKIDATTGKPQEYKNVIKTPTGNTINNYNQSLYYKPTSQGLEVTFLNIERLIYEAIAPMGTTYLTRILPGNSNQKISLITASYKFKNIIPQNVAGW
ncbi:hypothetical protein [Pedobacter hiemivivus]|uniref:Uncharacterized protein n=1 Tax=Pedobacter hiemivivus TaxID=2530454 RepID=A0A4R0NFA9_9SPHI|nr:hypothetical protein [Pedobacter hiemivivus]TCC99160.1 hypothetical protein EZ444_00300 [Pedobacter hiemivivus]